MTPANQVLTITSFLEKITNYKGGALIIISAPITEGYLEIIYGMFSHIELKAFAMPFVVGAISLMTYSFFYAIDFITGIKAARFEAKDKTDYLRSDKFWSSMWKIGMISTMVFGMTFFSFVFALIKMDYLYNIVMFAMVIICIMASLFDIHSIGENHRRRFQTKPTIFVWLEKITTLIDEQIIAGIKNGFNKIFGNASTKN